MAPHFSLESFLQCFGIIASGQNLINLRTWEGYANWKKNVIGHGQVSETGDIEGPIGLLR